MGPLHFLLSCTLLALCSADQTIGVVNSMLDPNRITWWRSKWAPAPIQLSVNNLSQPSALTFYICPSTTITKGVFEVTFPTGFAPVAFGTAQTVSSQVLTLTGQTFLAGQDTPVVINGQNNPATAGAYGPFGIRTRYSANSQQVDVNLTFGSVYITTAAGTLSTLSVTVVGAPTAGTVVNSSGNTLSFKFNLGVSLWRYDTFIIVTDSRWTIASSAACASAKYTGYWNNLNGTNTANPYALQCIVTPQSTTTPVSQYVYIYGMASDGLDLVVSGNQYVDLRVSSVTSPGAVFTNSAYTWTVSTSRFGTTTILESAQVTAGPQLTAATITSATWTPTWGLSTTSIGTGTTYFMDLSFTTINPIPAGAPGATGGYVTITVTETLPGMDPNWFTGAVNCYIVTIFAGAFAPTCTISTNVITISKLPAVGAGTTIKIRNTVNFLSTTTDSISSILTYAPGGYLIDSTANALAIITLVGTITNTALTSTNFGIQFQNIVSNAFVTTALAGGSGDVTQSLQFFLNLGSFTVNSATTFGIYCPITSSIDDFNIGIPTSPSYSYTNDATTGVETLCPNCNTCTAACTTASAACASSTATCAAGCVANYSCTSAVGSCTACSTTTCNAACKTISGGATACSSVTCLGPTALTTNLPQYSPTTSGSTTPGSITFNGSIGSISAANYHLLIQPASGATTFITLPRIVNNLATAYECRAMVSTTVGSTTTTASGAIRFAIAPQTWKLNTFALPCTSYLDGAPAIVTIQPNVVSISTATTATYYVEVTFTGVTATFGTNSGLTATTASPGANNEGQLTSGYTSAYPVAASAGTSSSTAAVAITGSVYYQSGTSVTVAVPGLTLAAYATASTPSTVLVFPIGGYAVGASAIPVPTITSYYILTADPRYKYITHSQASSSGATTTLTAPSATANTALLAGVTGSTGTIINGTPSASLTLGLNIISTTTIPTNYYIFFQLGTGFTWSSTNKSISGTTSYTNTYFFSLNNVFAYPGVLVYNTGATANGFTTVTTGANWTAALAATLTTTVTLSGFSVPLGLPGSTLYTTVLLGGGSGACTVAATGSSGTNSLPYTINSGAITSVSVNPSSIKGYGPDGVNISHTVSFSLPHGIPLNGVLTMAFNSAWQTTSFSSVCATTGLTNASATTTVACSVASNTATVTGFADFSSATSSTTITITVNGLLAPTYSSGTLTQNFATTITTTTKSGGVTIDTIASPTNAVTITASSVTGTTTWTAKTAYPSTAGTTAASDLYLKFSLTHALPVGGTITLTSALAFKLAVGSVSNFCFFTLQYSSCSIVSSTLVITLGQAYTAQGVLELYLDSAVTNPSSATTTTATFSIVSAWGGVTIDTDTTVTATNFTPTPLLSSVISIANAGLSFAPTTTGEVATYTFDFKDTVAYTVGDQYWILFPSQYDYFLGDIWTWFTNEPNTFYIDCSSAQLGVTWCSVDHGIVVVTGSTAVTASTEIVLNINSVINPVTGSATSPFMIYHVSSSGAYLTINQSFGTVTPTGYPTNLLVRSLSQTSNLLFQTSDYTWRLYITDTMNSDSQLQVLFPREYDLNHFDQKTTYSCSSTYYIDATSTTSTAQSIWNSASSCSVSNNLVSLPAATTSIAFNNIDIVTWTVQGVTNTQWAQPRTAYSSTVDFDVTDSAVWPVYSFWASKFTFFIYRTSATNLAYTSRSYPNTNAAYTGFNDGFKPLYVNLYSPQNKLNRIVVRAGTQTTDIYISTASALLPMSAKQIVLTPTTNSKTPDSGKLKYTSATDNWILFQAYWQIRFRVAAAIDLIKGLYYINWSNSETKQTGLNNVQYDPPVGTLVEVIGLTTGVYTFTVGTIPNIYTGFTSVPIKISITNAPHADVTVGITVTGSITNISVNPASLTFGPDVNSLYFQLTVASGFDLTQGTVQSLTFTLSGSDASVYTITATQKFTITQSSTSSTAGNVVSWGLGTATKTIETSTPTSDQVGVIYYQLSAAGAVVPSFSTLKATVGSLVSTNSTSTSTTSSGSNTQSDPATGETWANFQYRLYKTHLQQVWVGSVAMPTTTASTTVTFNWLYAATTYQLAGYLDNLSTATSPIVHTETFTTTSIAAPQPFTLAFSGVVPSSFGSKIAQETASLQGVNPLRLGNATVTTSRRELVATTVTTNFAYTLVSNRFSEGPDPSAQAVISSTQQTTLATNLVADGITNAPLNTVTLNAVPSRITPTWTTSPTSGGATSNSISITLRSNTAGQTCCVALTSSTTAPTADQVILGLNPTSTAASNACITTNTAVTTNTVQITSLQASTSYYAYCTATDNYPLWPTQMSYTTSNPITPVSITTLATTTTTVVTSASYFGGLLLLVAMLLH